MLLEGKQAVIYGGGGSIGGAVARAFAREGAVHLAGRTLDRVADHINGSGGTIDAIPADFERRAYLIDSLVEPTMLGRGATLEDVGNVAAFAASDHARTITGSPINISCGAIID